MLAGQLHAGSFSDIINNEINEYMIQDEEPDVGFKVTWHYALKMVHALCFIPEGDCANGVLYCDVTNTPVRGKFGKCVRVQTCALGLSDQVLYQYNAVHGHSIIASCKSYYVWLLILINPQCKLHVSSATFQ